VIITTEINGKSQTLVKNKSLKVIYQKDNDDLAEGGSKEGIPVRKNTSGRRKTVDLNEIKLF
jgi:hypothetical protein